jgi:predicted nucleotidyltransferase component of viral defense system
VTERTSLRVHLDPPAFAEAVRFTASSTGFEGRLVEKDYYCTLALEQLGQVEGLVFKGGTCLAKVHAGFYRLSEDLDFVIATPAGATRGWRRSQVTPLKARLDGLSDRQAALRVVEQLAGANVSTQYLATVAYTSVVTGREETIKIEVALREPLLVEPVESPASSVLRDPLGGQPLVEPIPVRCIALIEALAEKLRAALSRREPAIRDLFDVDWAAQHRLLDPADNALVALVRSKLAVAGNAAVDVSAARIEALRRQVDLGLRPVLRPADFATFNLDRAFRIVSDMAAKVGIMP